MTKFKQRDLILLTFNPSQGSEINKRRPALVMSRDRYNLASNLAIICPITSTDKTRPYLISLVDPVKTGLLKEQSKVNTAQVFSFDMTESGHRDPERIGSLDPKEFLLVSQYFLQNFNFPF